jgi:hypothetical protein
MLRPTKHSHPDLTIVAVAAVLLSVLRKKRSQSYNALEASLRKRLPERVYLFLPAVHLLFLMGLLTYRRQTDSFELTR